MNTTTGKRDERARAQRNRILDAAQICFAERGFQVAEDWWGATLERLQGCGCDSGCPTCCVSPKCGNGNQLLDKASATELLGVLLGN